MLSSGTSSTSPCPMRYVDIVLGNQALPAVCGEQSRVSAVAWVVWGFHGAPLASSLIRCNSFPALKVSFGGKRRLVEALSPLLFSSSVEVSFIYVCILRAYTVVGFPTNPQIALTFSCLSPYSLPYSPFPSPFLPDLLQYT